MITSRHHLQEERPILFTFLRIHLIHLLDHLQHTLPRKVVVNLVVVCSS